MESILLGRNVASNVVHCPFNTSHSMPQKTLIIHLTKCPDRKPNQRICPFNNLHVVDASNLADHEAECPDRLDFDQMIYQIPQPRLEVTLKGGPEPNDDMYETWDDANTYPQRSNQTIPVQNVIKTIKQTPCFMKPPAGCTKSQKKKYRSEAQKVYRDVDLSYKANSNVNERIVSMTPNGSKNVNQQVKDNGLFFGKRPNT